MVLANLVSVSDNGKMLVSGRMLHEFLEIGRDFTNWIKQMLEYGFEEEGDYFVYSPKLASKGRGGHNKKEYALTLDMAKEICMIQRSDKGRQARKYFIECEKKLRENEQKKQEAFAQLPDFTNPIVAARAWADQLEARQVAEAKVAELAPKAQLTDDFMVNQGHVTFQQLMAILGLHAPYKFRQWLCDNKWCWAKSQVNKKVNSSKWMPYKARVEAGQLRAKTWVKNKYSGITLAWTLPGIEAVRQELEATGYVEHEGDK